MAKQIHEVFKENNIQDKNNDINIAASNIFAIGVVLAWQNEYTCFWNFSSRGSAISAIFTETDQGNLEENWTLMMDSVCSCVKFIFMELKSMKKC